MSSHRIYGMSTKISQLSYNDHLLHAHLGKQQARSPISRFLSNAVLSTERGGKRIFYWLKSAGQTIILPNAKSSTSPPNKQVVHWKFPLILDKEDGEALYEVQDLRGYTH